MDGFMLVVVSVLALAGWFFDRWQQQRLIRDLMNRLMSANFGEYASGMAAMGKRADVAARAVEKLEMDESTKGVLPVD